MLALGCALLLCLSLWNGALHAQPAAPASLEHQVKAAYLYKFTGFVDWPEGSFARADSALLIGVAGNDELAEQAQHMVAGRSVNGHPLVVRKIERGDALAGLHVLFVGTMNQHAMAELLDGARSHSVLSVSDERAAARLGSMVNFVVADDRLRFEVALGVVMQTGLRISARMLAAAYRVQAAS